MKPSAEFESGLAELRGHIDAVDARLMELLAERQRVVAAVAELKKAHGQPVYHPAREEDLISRRRSEAAAKGLTPDFVEDVFRRLLRESRVAQTDVRARMAIRPEARVLVVGGAGQMGQCLVRWFAGAGYATDVLDRDDWHRAPELCTRADVAILSVPIDATGTVAGRLGPMLRRDCVLADVTSLKRAPMASMLAAHEGPVLGLHPMFGPTTTTMDKQIVVVVEGRAPRQAGWLVQQLAAWGAVIVHADADEHDEAMEIVQALRHFATFLFGRFLAQRRVDLQRTLDFSSPIYRLELGMVGRLFAQDPGLYSEIIFATPERRRLLTQFLASVRETSSLVETDDRAEFREEFRRIAEWFGPFSDQAIRESSYLIDKLIERF